MKVTLIEQPMMKLLIKREIAARDYFAYCEEVGCDIREDLKAIAPLKEPMALWLPEQLITPRTSQYVQGIEWGEDETIPPGFEVIELPPGSYLRFQGEPFDEANYAEAIYELRAEINGFKPSLLGYSWDDTLPRIQLEPVGKRGYIELKGVSPLTADSL